MDVLRVSRKEQRMQEHRQKRSRRGARMANANYALDEAARTTVIGLFNSFDGGEDFAVTHLQSEYLTKYCDESRTPAAERKQRAIAKFRDIEERNAATNLRISVGIDPGYNILTRVTYGSFLRFARRLCRDILGPLRDEVVLGSFSGGASTSRPRTSSLPAQKFVGKADITEEAWKFLDTLFREAPMLRQYGVFSELNTVEGSVLFTVPKKTDIDRCACKEPDVNMYLQKGVGAHIRRRLRRCGINLNDQSINRGLAKVGSEDSSLATLDLSSASDTITQAAVRALLPKDWYLYLDDIRSHSVRIDGEYHRMEMFSSMGNGFTFELESLLFYVLMRTTAYFGGFSGTISVYGDDLIIPSGMYEDASWVLKEFGFSLNPDKSFHDGPFRESCGGHYRNGVDVTPFYLKREPSRLTDVIRVANQLRRWAFADPSRRYEHPRVYLEWLRLAELVPEVLWGGYDYSVDTKLVSPPVRDSRVLVRVQEKRTDVTDKGSYLCWHNTNWNRSEGPEEPSINPVSTNQICRLRRTPLGAPVCQDWFFQELV